MPCIDTVQVARQSRVSVIARISLMLACIMSAAAAAQDSDRSETGVVLGAQIFSGPDIRVYHRPAGSNVRIGVRYLDIEEDFDVVGAADSSDKEYTSRKGVYVDYLLEGRRPSEALFVSLAIFDASLELECEGESDRDTATGLYLGGGYHGTFSKDLGYSVGMLISPGTNLATETSLCSSENETDLDLHIGIAFRF